ncbi:hypothetical protein HDU98_007085 [Podochytrium sp. JEL0797]|nr:hypothetical protein HDU98_007085 [Podochytrium sp. JEL0797]
MLPHPVTPRPRLDIVQQPQRARVCGFTNKRPISPPPIIQLTGIDAETAQSLVCFASLWSSDAKANLSISTKCASPFAYTPITASSTPTSPPLSSDMSETSSTDSTAVPTYTVETTIGYEKSFNMIGTPISECLTLQNLDGQDGLFFCFPDLAVRTTGVVRIRFEVYDTAAREHGKGFAPVANVMSDAFEVFRPEVFPGVVELSELSAWFIRQGVPIKTKFGVQG